MSTREGDREECAAKRGGVHGHRAAKDSHSCSKLRPKDGGIPGTFSSCDQMPDSSNLSEDRFILFPGPEVQSTTVGKT